MGVGAADDEATWRGMGACFGIVERKGAAGDVTAEEGFGFKSGGGAAEQKVAEFFDVEVVVFF